MKFKVFVCMSLMCAMLFSGCGGENVKEGDSSEQKNAEQTISNEEENTVTNNGDSSSLEGSESKEKIAITNSYGDLIEVNISKDKAIKIAKQKQKEYFGIDISDDMEVMTTLEGGYSIVEPEWSITFLKKGELFCMCFIDANSGDVSSGSFKRFGDNNSSENELALEEVKEIALKYLVDKKILNNKSDVKYIGKCKEYMAKTRVSVEFVSVTDENDIYNVVVENANKEISFFSNYKKRTAEEQKQLEEYNAAQKS